MKGISEWLAGHRVAATLLGVALVALLAVPTVRDLLPGHVRACLDAPGTVLVPGYQPGVSLAPGQ